MPYNVMYILAIIVTLTITALTLVQAAAVTLMLSPQQLAVIGIVSGVLGAANGFLPRVQQTPNAEARSRGIN